MTLLIKDIMNRNVKTVSPKATIKDAINNMTKYHIGCLVVTEDNKIVGILTERDVLKQLLNFDILIPGSFSVNLLNSFIGGFSISLFSLLAFS